MPDGYDEIIEFIERQEGLNRRELIRKGAGLTIGATALASLTGLGGPGSAAAAVLRPTMGAATRGGTLKVTDEDFRTIKDPALLTGSGDSNIVRQIAEYLMTVDSNGNPQPYLLKSLKASPNLKTWTMVLRDGPRFNTPKPRAVTADDVIFNLKRWLNPKLGSSMASLLSSYLKPSGIEKVNAKTVRLHLTAPTITLPFDLFHYAGPILPREFEGDFTKQPWGTGPFALKQFVEGEKAILTARKDYWQMGRDGKPLPYLDGIQQVNIKLQATQQLAGLSSGQFDLVNRIDISIYEPLKSNPKIRVVSVPTGAFLGFRVRTDQEPWKDPRVRLALKLAQDRAQLTNIALRGQGVLAGDDMAVPSDPADPGLKPPPRDVARAKELLAAAGYQDGFTTELNVLNAPEWQTITAQALQQQLKDVGITVKLTPMGPDQFWPKWTEYNFAAVEWGHRPLSLQLWNLAMRGGAAWNETHWNDSKFDALLNTAGKQLDPKSREKTYRQIQAYVRANAGYAAPFNENRLFAFSKKLANYLPRPDAYQFYGAVWKNK